MLKRKETSRVGRKRDSHPKGVRSGGEIKVKGQRATAAQRSAIDDALGEAHRLNASRRVMIALVMAGTQESLWTRAGKTGNDDVSYLQQGRNWISAANASKADLTARAFLIGHEADVGGTGQVQGWKQRHGSLKNAPGDLDAAITKVQGSVGGYGPWEKESTATVQTWVGDDGFGSDRTYVKRYEFTRGERHGARETSWDAMGRLAEEVASRRWAATNVLFYASEDELRAGAPAVEVHGDEAWLLGRPQWDWGSGRAVTECTIRVLADRWGVLPGGVVLLNTPGPTKGRWLVKTVSGARLDSPEIDVVLKRPTRHKPEPAPETATTDGGGGGSSELKDACSHISTQDRDYLYGGGHGKPLSKIGAKDPLDCSSSCSLALKRAGMFEGTVAITSGVFADSWGKPGKGRDFTVWANDTHVWIEGHDSDGKFAWRFDTGGGLPRGPHVREKPRDDQARFTARHWS